MSTIGRPRSRLKAGDYQRVEDLAAVGAPRSLVAWRLGVAPGTFTRLLERDARAKAAWEAGRAQLEGALVGRLRELALTTRNPVPSMFLLKSLFHYVDNPTPKPEEGRVRIEIVLPKALSPEQYRKVLDVTPQRALAEVAGHG